MGLNRAGTNAQQSSPDAIVRKKFFEDSWEPQLKQLFVSPQAQSSTTLALTGAIESLQQFLSDTHTTSLVVLGDSGQGKSSLLKYLAYNLFDQPIQCSKGHSAWLPLFIHLPTILADKRSIDLLDDFMGRKLRLDGPEKRVLLQQPLLLCLDGFDELKAEERGHLLQRNIENNSELKRLIEQGRCKIISSCRPEVLPKDNLEWQSWFSVNNSEAKADHPNSLLALRLQPFCDNKIKQYLEQYVTVNRAKIFEEHKSENRDWSESETYYTQLQAIPGLRTVATNPFVLSMITKTLPQLVERFARDNQALELTRAQIYEAFIDEWLKVQVKRIFTQQQTERLSWAHQLKGNLEEYLWQYARQLALLQFRRGKLNVNISEEDTLSPQLLDPKRGMPNEKSYREHHTHDQAILEDKDHIETIRSGCLLNTSKGEFQFLHKSLIEFLSADQVFHGLTETDAFLEGVQRELELRHRPEEKVAQAEPQSPALAEQITLLTSQLIVQEPQVIQYLADRVKEHEQVKHMLRRLIELSKNKDKIRSDIIQLNEQAPAKHNGQDYSLAASNAITVLVAAGVSFDHEDLSHIRIPYANLTGMKGGWVNLSHTDLTGVNATDVNWFEANLNHSIMTDINFGVRPDLVHHRAIVNVEFISESHALFVDKRGDVYLYDINHDKAELYLSAGFWQYDDVYVAAFHQKRQCIAIGRKTSAIAVGLLAEQQKTWVSLPTLPKEAHSPVTAMTFSDDGNRVIAGYADGYLREWSLSEQRCLTTTTTHRRYKYPIAQVVYIDHNTLIIHDYVGQPILGPLCPASLDEHLEIKVHESLVTQLAYSHRHRLIILGHEDGTIGMASEEGQLTQVCQGHTDRISALSLSQDGHWLASGSWDRSVRLWRLPLGECRQSLEGVGGPVQTVVFSSTQQQLITCTTQQLRTHHLNTDLSARSELTPAKMLRHSGHTGQVHSMAFSPKGDLLASGGGDDTVRLWAVDTGQCRQVLKGHTNSVCSIAFSPQGDWLASGGNDETVRLWAVNTGQCRRVLKGHEGSITSIAFSPQGDWLASGSEDYTVRLWSVNTGQCRQVLKEHTSFVNSIAFSPQGDWLASGGSDKTVRLWAVDSGQCRRVLKGHENTINSIAFSPQGDLLASGSHNNTVRLWAVDTGQCHQVLKEHTGWVNSIAFSPQGDWLASGGSDKTVRLWAVDSGQCHQVLEGHTNHITSIAFPPQGDWLASASADGTVHLWSLKTFRCVDIYSNTQPSPLRLIHTDISGARGLSPSTQRLLIQSHAIGTPSTQPVAHIRRMSTSDKIPGLNYPEPIFERQEPCPSLLHSETLLSYNQWVVHLTRKPDTKYKHHVFILIEGLNAFGKAFWLRYELTNTNCPPGKAKIVRFDIQDRVQYTADNPNEHHNLLIELTQEARIVCLSWSIQRLQGLTLINSIEDDMGKLLPYAVVGNRSILTFSQEERMDNCFTWARAHLLKLNYRQIQQDLKEKSYEWIIANPAWVVIDNQNIQQRASTSPNSTDAGTGTGLRCTVM